LFARLLRLLRLPRSFAFTSAKFELLALLCTIALIASFACAANTIASIVLIASIGSTSLDLGLLALLVWLLRLRR